MSQTCSEDRHHRLDRIQSRHSQGYGRFVALLHRCLSYRADGLGRSHVSRIRFSGGIYSEDRYSRNARGAGSGFRDRCSDKCLQGSRSCWLEDSLDVPFGTRNPVAPARGWRNRAALGAGRRGPVVPTGRVFYAAAVNRSESKGNIMKTKAIMAILAMVVLTGCGVPLVPII